MVRWLSACASKVPTRSRVADGFTKCPIRYRYQRTRKEPQSQSISNFALYRDMNKMPVNHPKLYRLAVKLGLPAVSLLAIEAGWNGKNYTIPMYNGNCECVGIRLRSQNGMKFAVRGSKNGLFIPLTGVYPDCYDTLYVVEGPTDTAAMYAMKLPAIGRPDCNSGVEYLKQFLGCKRRDVIIIADRDKPHDATQCPPGLKGAYRAAKAIKPLVRGVKIVLPPVYKDVRQWYHAGCIKEAIIAVAKNTGWIK